MIPIINGMNLSWRLEMSLSVLSFLAQYTMIAIGKTEAKTRDMISRTMNLPKLNAPFSKDNTRHIIKNRGMHIIGGFVNVEIVFAIFNLFIRIFILLLN